MISTNNSVKVGYINIAGAGLVYIREYDAESLTTRVQANNKFVDLKWNGSAWTQVEEVQETSPAPTFAALEALTCGDYQKWLRKQIRENGRRAVVGNAQHSPVDLFVKERTGLDFILLVGGEIEVTVGNTRHEFMTDAINLAYYIYDDNGNMIVTAGKALEMAMLEDASTLIIG